MGGGFIDRFSDDAAGYRAARPTYPAALFEDLAAFAPGRALAWDVGSGTGQAALGLARQFERVHASEPSAALRAEACPHERIACHVEPAEHSSLPDRSVDLALAAQSLHWFDLDLFYAEAARVLKPGGVLAAIGYDWMYVAPEVDSAINRELMPLLAPFWATQNRILWDGYRSIPFPGEEIRIGAHAIYLEWSAAEALAYIGNWSAVRAAGADRVAQALGAVESAWGPMRRRVVMPLHIRAARLGSGQGVTP
jgi:SAM-dependent methyltransferase